ncbi:MAG: hypothetical protein GY715_08225 [Planctomycetes bacterium]|nr:hypothetical protein [Planctomycetota bacterium]
MINPRHVISVTAAAIGLIAAAAPGQLDFDPQPGTLIAFDGIGSTVCHDMDGVNGPDLVVGSGDFGGHTYGIFYNDGAGGFGSPTILDIGTDMPDIAVGDWDGNGLTDVFGLHERIGDDRLRIFRQTSLGVWDTSAFAVLPGNRDLIVSGDLNGDAKVDLVIGNPDAGLVEVYLNTGTGGPPFLTSSYSMGAVTDIRICDFNADGAPDLATVSASDGFFRVRMNDGLGNFPSASANFIIGSEPSWIACGDLNGDGLPDVAIAKKGNDTVIILLAIASGGFTVIPPVPAGPFPSHIVCGDFDCDGDIDLVVSRGLTGGGALPPLRGLLNDGTGTGWTETAPFGGTASIGGASGLHACEWDGAPGLDLVELTPPGVLGAVLLLNIGAACDACIDPPAGAKAWYAADLCLPDDLYGNHDGAVTGGLFCPEPKVGGAALGFDPTPTYTTVPDDCELNPDDHDFSVNTWVRTNAPGFQPILAKSGAPGYELTLLHGQPRFVVCDSAFCWLTEGSSLINDGDWHHVAFTMERGPSTIIRLYVDGLLENTVLAAGMGEVNPSTALLLGAIPSPTPSSFMDGAIDELQIHDRLLSVGEIQAIYRVGIAGQCKDVCAPSGECVSPEFPVLTAGTEDDFALPSEPATPGAVLAATCAGSVDFDVVPAGASVCHTFDALPEKIVGGTLTVRIQANATGDACNDEIRLQATGGIPAFLWASRFGEAGTGLCSGSDGLLECEWDAPREYTLCLDLAALPTFGGTTTSVIDDMNASGRLDVQVLDDTAVDSMELRVVTCPCPSDLSGNGSVGFEDTLQIIANWGPCPDPCPGTPCPWDLNGNCNVDFADILVVIATWGPC